MKMKTTKHKKIFAISSSGGHWAQLLRLRPAFEGSDVIYATTQKGSENQVAGHRIYFLPDANRNALVRLVLLMLIVFYVIVKERPDIVISTGAAPGYFALKIGHLFGAKTIWLESIANAEKHSLSTKLVRSCADLFLTQWPHMATPQGPFYKGSVF